MGRRKNRQPSKDVVAAPKAKAKIAVLANKPNMPPNGTTESLLAAFQFPPGVAKPGVKFIPFPQPTPIASLPTKSASSMVVGIFLMAVGDRVNIAFGVEQELGHDGSVQLCIASHSCFGSTLASKGW